MHLALIPLPLQSGKRHDNARVMAGWVDQLHNRADLIAFPKIPFTSLPVPGSPEDEGLLDQSDLVRGFAMKRAAYVAVGFHHTRTTGQRNLLVLADRTGQTLSQSQVVSYGDQASELIMPPLFLHARIAGVPLGITHANDRIDEEIFDMALRAHVRAVIVLLALTGAPEEHRRIAAHNPPAALDKLKEDDLARLARGSSTTVFAVNAISPDTDDACGPCGGVYHIDPRGRFLHEQRLYDEAVFETEIKPD